MRIRLDPYPLAMRRIRLRWVLVSAIVALFLGASTVALLEFDQSLARRGRGGHVPRQAWTVTRWFAIAFGVVAVALWVVERRRSHARITVGVVIAVVAVVATPIALAIAQPRDTAMTVVSFDARTGQRRWQNDIDLLTDTAPVKLDGHDRVVLYGFAPSGRCETRPERFMIDRRDGRTLARTTAEPPSAPHSAPLGALTAGGIRFEIVRPTQPDAYARLEARDTTGRVLWSIPSDAGRMPSVLYADETVVAIYVPDTGADERTPSTRLSEAGYEAVVAVLDARTGRRRWTIRASAHPFGAPLFNRDASFAIEGDLVVVHATQTGAVLVRYPLQSPIETFPDAQLQHAGRHDTIALIEGGAGRLTLLNRAGTVRWSATLPRAMPSAQLTALDDAIYVTGGGALGYQCGGE